jgi:hypothetical protein
LASKSVPTPFAAVLPYRKTGGLQSFEHFASTAPRYSTFSHRRTSSDRKIFYSLAQGYHTGPVSVPTALLCGAGTLLHAVLGLS